MRNKLLRSSWIVTATVALSVCLGAVSFVGCERKTPEGSLEVDRNIDTGEVDVEVTDKD
jgi:hypothetical protein